jgi:hypothetical protein
MKWSQSSGEGDQRHQRGVFSIVVQRIAGADPFYDKRGSFIEKGCDVGFDAAECPTNPEDC